MKRVLIVKKYSGYGGIEYQIENMASYLMSHEWQVFFMTNEESPLSKSLEAKGVNVYVVPFEGIVKTAKCVKKVCCENNISIIQSHMLKDSMICRIVKLRDHSITHIFRVHTYIDCSHISNFKKLLYHLVCWLTDPFVDRYVSINQYNCEEMRRRTHISKRKITVVNNVISPLVFCKKDACEYKNGHIAMVANFVDFKGHDVLLEGINLLRGRGYNIVAHLFGSVPGFGTDHEDYHRLDIIKETIKEKKLEDLVIIHGYSSNIAKDIKDCGMIVLPSDAEGTPNVLLQGMMLHKVVIASNVGGIPEFVIEGKTGFLHEPGNPKDFADAVERAYNTPDTVLDEITVCAADFVADKYSVDNIGRQFVDIYNEVYQKEK